METSQRIGIDRLGLVVAPKGEATPSISTAILAELAHVGVRIVNPEDMTDGMATTFKDVVEHIRLKRGLKGTYSPLFSGFPEKLPEFDLAELRFMFAACRLISVDFYTEDDIRTAMDFSSFEWWPASSVPQDVEKARFDRSIQDLLPGDKRIEWITLRVVSAPALEGALKSYMQDCFASGSSLRDDVKTDLEELTRLYGVEDIDASEVRFRENRTLLFKLVWETNRASLIEMRPSPDDLLRLFASLTESDTSLAKKIRFPKLSKADRRLVVEALENSERLGDVFRRRGLWLSIDRGLHLGEFDAPKTQEAFARLRGTRHDKTSFGSRFETALVSDYPAAVALAAAEAPGVLARSLRRVAALAVTVEDRKALLDGLKASGDRMPLRVLLAAYAQITDNGQTYPRAAFAKSGSSMLIENGAGHLAVSRWFRDELLEALDDVIQASIKAKGSWAGEKVYIEPALSSVLIPDQLRETAQGLVQIERGSRLPLGETKVVRLFVHWKEAEYTTDLDLSCLALDSDFNVVDQVSWTNLGNGVMGHSGDLTSAPTGAQEFIDIDLAKAKAAGASKNWRYLVPVVFRYSGENFASLTEANVGWMLRDSVDSKYRVFDPATVANAFELTGTQRTAVPLLVDLQTDEVLYVDVYMRGEPYAYVERDGDNISVVAKAVAERARIKTSVMELAKRHVLGRGAELVEVWEDATITFGMNDECTFDVLRPEKLLAELI